MTLGHVTMNAIVCQRKIHEKVRELIHSEIPAQQLSILYLVALNEGISHGEISKHLKMPQATVSRNVAKLASRLVEDRNKKFVEIGYGLLRNQDDAIDPRRNVVYLTKRGREVIEAIAKTICDCMH